MSRGLIGKKANLSPLMKAKRGLLTGQVANLCPFGCSDGHLDDYGYCFHLVGFSNDKKTYEPLVSKNGRRSNEGKKKEQVKKADKLLRITTSYRVYRDVKPSKEEEARLAAIELPPEEIEEMTEAELEVLAESKSTE